MVDPAAVATMVEAGCAERAPDELLVEIGPGTGVLTRCLLAAGAPVLAVELDRDLAPLLRRELAGAAFELIEGDALVGKHRLHSQLCAALRGRRWRLVANLPYDASLPVLLNAFACADPPTRAVVTVQLEAAQRLCAAPGDPAWGASAAVAQAAGRGSILRRLPPGCFEPPPRVHSAILRWLVERRTPEGFGSFCRGLFASRRKHVERALRDLHRGLRRDEATLLCHRAGLAPELRVERISVAGLQALHQEVNACTAN